ncbi:hypothetical protein SEA_KOZIE_13 [Microbacterium phage Kozie]|uniref:Uncharacterized protein n=1 Tax=Microbacterium phage Kozie TaxID=2885981 RepID=A0AAE8Y7M8_9CAUD|nr:hypothetical protein QC998_gp13 [Microbacterium phage Kozie]UDL16209.1 hypothetical protein SEA_KOZIE_13 [Microbacterium phage Kozie]
MPRVGRIRVTVEIVDDDGSATIHEAVGVPAPGYTPSVSIVPHHRAQIRRSTREVIAAEVVEVGVRIDARLVAAPDGARLFGVETTAPETLAIAEAPRDTIVLPDLDA